MILLAVAFGISIVIAVAAIRHLPYSQRQNSRIAKLLLRALSSFLAASALAMLFNTPCARCSEPVFWHWLQISCG